MPISETPLRLNVAAFSALGKPGAAVAVVLGVQQPASDLRAGGPILTVIAHAYDLDGNSVAMKRATLVHSASNCSRENFEPVWSQSVCGGW